MKAILSIILLLWISGSSYWYVCHIRCDCRQQAAVDTLVVAAKPEVSLPEKLVLHFANGSAISSLTDPEKGRLEEIRAYAAAVPGSRITVTGYTDNTGSAEINERLGKSRAESARQVLITAGISGESIEVAAKGPVDPVADNATEAGRSQNRRVEIEIH
jgi:outer membrane protein OmpA-like peptidoglycan-associated protein